MYYMYRNSLVLKKLESLKSGSFLVVHYNCLLYTSDAADE